MSRQDRPQMFDFEVISSQNLLFIPLSVRFHLDRTALRISLEDWQKLPMPVRVALTCYAVGEPLSATGAGSALHEHAPGIPEGGSPDDDFAAYLETVMLTHVGHSPATDVSGAGVSPVGDAGSDSGSPTATPLPVFPGDEETLPSAVAGQCELAGLPVLSDAVWQSLTRFQRYALVKLSRKKDRLNHDFVPAMREFGLAPAGI